MCCSSMGEMVTGLSTMPSQMGNMKILSNKTGGVGAASAMGDVDGAIDQVGSNGVGAGSKGGKVMHTSCMPT